MLRALVLLLFLANLVFYVWTQGWLDQVVGIPADGGRDPQRLQRQVHPDAIRLLPPEAATAASGSGAASASIGAPAQADLSGASAAVTGSSVEVGAAGASSAAAGASSPGFATAGPGAAGGSAAASGAAPQQDPAGNASAAPAQAAALQAAPLCLEAGPFSADERAAAEKVLRGALPAGAWQARAMVKPGMWMVYMGPYPSPEALQGKEKELRDIGVDFAPVRAAGPYAGGLSLGRFEQRVNAEQALARLVARNGVRTARIVNLRAPQALTLLRVPRADGAMRTALVGLSGALAGKGFEPCAEPAAAAP